jgi:hypothetical protein
VRQQFLPGELERRDDDTIDVAAHRLQESDLLFAGPLGVVHDRVIAGRHEYVVQAAHNHRIERVGHIRDHQPDRHRPLRR